MTIPLDTTASYVIVGNYGNDTLALIQWAYAQGLKQVCVVSVDTGWAAPEWDKHVVRAEQFVRTCDYQPIRLISPTPFAKLMLQRQSFPSTKFQWCANILKGLPILDWLDTHDPQLNSILLLGHRRESARSKKHLSQQVQESEFFGERCVIYPLLDMATEDRNALLLQTGFTILSHRSLECDPCINSDNMDLARLSALAVVRTADLETLVGTPMFKHLAQENEHSNIANLVSNARELVDVARPITSDVLENMGCGDPYGCGI